MLVSRPVLALRGYAPQLLAPPHIVFPRLCPVREAEWANGWDPIEVWSESGFAEEGCVFATPGEPAAVWVVTQLDPDSFFVEKVKVTPGVTVCRLTIQLEPTKTGVAADVCYRHTSVGPSGDQFVGRFTESHYASFMRQWEDELNHYLSTGQKLPLGLE
jgi:hypothetical protein